MAGLGPALVKVPGTTDHETVGGEVALFTENPRGPENFRAGRLLSCVCNPFPLNRDAAELKGLV